MKTVVVFKEQSDHARPVLDFLRDFERQTGRKLETLNPETREGSTYCQAHDITQYPTLIATDDNGMHLQTWVGLPMPTISEVSYYSI